MSDRFLAIHNLDLANREQQDPKATGITGTAFKRVKAGTVIAQSDLTEAERDELLARGAIREATSDEGKAADERERQETAARAQGGYNVQRQTLLQKQAGARAKIQEKHDAQAQAELAKLDEPHAKQREELEKKIAAGIAPAEKTPDEQAPADPPTT